RSLRALERPFRADSLRDRMARAAKGTAQDYLQMQALLESPRLLAKERKELYQARRQLGLRLQEKTVPREKKDSAEDARKRTAAENERARWRARLAIDLLKLAGVVGADPLDKALDNKPDWQALGDKLREIYAKELRRQGEHVPPGDLAQA